MALFGFKREAGTGRGYVNESNPDYEIGTRLSRRQYDKFIEKQGARQKLPGADQIRETERQLEQLRDALARRETALDLRETELKLREQELQLEKDLFRKGRQSAGQRRYNTMLDAFVTNERRKGKTVNKRDARNDPVFKQAMEDIKGKPNKRKNPNIAAENVERRRRALAVVGGGDVFREYYERTYGQIARGTIGSRVASHASNRARGATSRNKARGRR